MTLHGLIALTRINKPIGIWLVFFPAAWGVVLASRAAGLDGALLFACFAGAVLVRSAGCIANDLADRRFDAQVERTRLRPLACGAVSVKEALALLVLFGLGALAVALMLPPTVLYVAIAAVPMILAYPFMKRLTWWPQMFLGLTFNLGAPIGWAAVTDAIEAPALWLYAGSVAWTFGYDTLYAHQDAADDARAGIKSSALALGGDTVRVVGLSYAFFLLCLTVAGAESGIGWPYYAGIVAAAAQLGWQLLRADIHDAALAGRLFRSNQWAGLAVLLGAAAAIS